jgi:hypothetical protein
VVRSLLFPFLADLKRVLVPGRIREYIYDTRNDLHVEVVVEQNKMPLRCKKMAISRRKINSEPKKEWVRSTQDEATLMMIAVLIKGILRFPSSI